MENDSSLQLEAFKAIQQRDLVLLETCLIKDEESKSSGIWSPTSTSTPNLLEYAIEERFPSAVEMLLLRIPRGLDVNAIVQGAFLLAMRKDFSEIIRIFLEYSLDGHINLELVEAFQHAVHKDQYDIAKRIIESPGFDVNAGELWEDEHPLSVAVYKNSLNLAQLLIQNGAIVDATDRNCSTALVVACNRQFFECCCTLLSHGADPNHRSMFCCSPLKACYMAGKDKNRCQCIIELLVRAGLNVNRESWIQTLELHNQAIEPGFHESLKHIGMTPRSLKMLTSVKLRDILSSVYHGISILTYVDQLPLPTLLKNYLKLSDAYKYMFH